jgi:Tol biopolymer transport system component
VSFLPDGRHIIFNASQKGRPPRLYLQDVDANGAPRPASEEGVQIPLFAKPVAPDGRAVAAVDSQGRAVLQPLDGGAARAVEGLDKGDVPIRWSRDGRGLYVFRFGEVPGRVYHFDLATRARQLVTELLPADPAGVGQLIAVHVTPDGSSCAYSYKQNLADLFLVGGLR